MFESGLGSETVLLEYCLDPWFNQGISRLRELFGGSILSRFEVDFMLISC
jgi:hypothetical protein